MAELIIHDVRVYGIQKNINNNYSRFLLTKHLLSYFHCERECVLIKRGGMLNYKYFSYCRK